MKQGHSSFSTWQRQHSSQLIAAIFAGVLYSTWFVVAVMGHASIPLPDKPGQFHLYNTINKSTSGEVTL